MKNQIMGFVKRELLSVLVAAMVLIYYRALQKKPDDYCFACRSV